MAASNRPRLSPQEGWQSDGRQVLHFRPTRWSRHNQVLEVTSGELLPGEPDVTPFIGPGLMRVGGHGHAAAPC
jgi:hypothetical protein